MGTKGVCLFSHSFCGTRTHTHTSSWKPRIRVNFKTFTPSNTGLDKGSEFPELGSAFKAAFIKSSCWWFAKKAVEIANSRPDEA